MEKRLKNTAQIILTKERIAPPGEWSKPIQLNLRATWAEIEATLKLHFEQEQKARGVRSWRRQIPWEGIEAYDRQIAGLSPTGENPSVSIRRARIYYRVREANR